MAKQYWKGSALLAPVPSVLITCGNMENPNAMTAAWTGIVSTHPPMTYVSIRKSRYSYEIIKRTKEFVINLTTSDMCRAVDYCGVRSGRNENKLEKCSIEIEKGKNTDVPIISRSPVSLECRVVDIIECGSHDMFLAEICTVAADEKYIDRSGRLDLGKADLIAYSHGEYFELGRKIGSFGYSVKKKKKNNKRKSK